MAEEEEVVEVTPVEVEEDITDLPGAVRGVLKKALVVDGVVKGLHEVAKSIDAGRAEVIFLAENCDEPAYKKLVQALALEKNVPLVDIADKKELGEWAGLCKIDKDGAPRKVRGASVVAVTDFGEEAKAHDYLMSYLQKS
mmetsp:Transcript_29496/g.44588  ORF Transcript_29496/g.44588 Transcript_29496/m.44588 type:complete len:140 (+) Transcript_29496:78-497(+)|eukprot:CAMPEP_0194765632 /NCGR_PEP_ID=MMETSP0323_2-20130528/27014_1 /TAXON_ID=2866 ORGANISM="Crypthecodinium cohnii, Strain Seligo" /NCGR_SAMPLE_ID=MMETSP0323_2 /ASSEMBLY_ACC=CAM_ASM_000346 /LENGTH=139 /DNA_ID=CAMNT_0039695531 /DNA_START=78 /DNA_END=497 /DNA_ORIENTATION=+